MTPMWIGPLMVRDPQWATDGPEDIEGYLESQFLEWADEIAAFDMAECER